MTTENQNINAEPEIDIKAAEKEIEKNLSEIGTAIEENPAIEEAEIIEETTQEAISENNPVEDQPIKTEIKKGRGRPKKENSIKKIKSPKIEKPETIIPETQQEPESDSLILLLNGSLIPLGSRIMNKNPEQCMITEKQMTDIVKLRPDSQLFGKSWFAYFGAIIGTSAANFIRADEEDKVLSVIKSIKNMTNEQRLEIRSLLLGE